MRVADQVDIIGKSNIEVENKDRVYGTQRSMDI